MTKKSILLFLFLSLCSAALLAQEGRISGVVFHDRNGNGVRDRGERGIRGIPVSNGDTILRTGRRGAFTLASDDHFGVFPVLPPDYTTAGKTGGLSLRGTMQNGKLVFPLIRQKPLKNFKIAAVGDVQVDDSVELSYAARTIFSELSNRRDIDFALYLGDLVNDNMGLQPAMVEQLGRMPHRSWTVAGNHDLDKGSPRLPGSYRQTFGPPDYAFYAGKTLFIALDNVSGYGSKDYSARLTDRQKRFVGHCLALTPESYTVVLCMHVPVYGSRFCDETAALFAGRERVLLLSGHTHMTSRHILAPNVCELVVGASCGSWWTGERGPDAVPLAIQRCGAPRNYYTVDFSDTGYSFAFKGVGLDEKTGMDIWVQGEEPIDSLVEALAELPPGSVVANIYGGTDLTAVEMRLNSGSWQPMEYSPMTAPTISRLIHWNKTAGYPTKYSRRTPLRRTVSPHLWLSRLPADLPAGTHSVEVRARDPYGFETSYTRQFIKRQ